MAHNILSKADRACVAYLISVGAGTADDTFPAKRSEDKLIPNTVCYSSRAPMLSPYSGIYTVNTAIMVKTNPAVDVDQDPDEPKATSEDRVSAVFDAFFAGLSGNDSAELANAITEAARGSGDADLQDFTVQAVMVKEPSAGFDPKGGVWIDTLDLEIVCYPASG